MPSLAIFIDVFLETLRDVLPIVTILVFFQFAILRRPLPNPHKLLTGFAMVLAGLSATGTTQVSGLTHLDRGYDNVEAKLRGVGATVERDGF